MRRLLPVLLLLATACTAVDADVEPETELAGEPVRVGAGPDTETALLAHVLAALLRFDEVPAEVVNFSDARDARQALELGDVDLQPAYTGETWLEVLGRPDPPGDPVESFREVKDHDEDEGIVWLRPSFGEGLDEPPANATFAFVVQGPPSVDADIRTLSQLAARLSEQPEARVCVDPDFASRPDGLPAVLAAYSVRSDREFLSADPQEAVLGVVAGDCLAGLTTATDGAAWRHGLRPVADDLRVFPAFVPLPQIREDVSNERPEIKVAIGPMAAELTTHLLGRWNARALAGEPLPDIAEAAAIQLRERAGRPVADIAGDVPSD